MVGQEIESIGYLLCAYKMQENAAQPHREAFLACPALAFDIWPFSGYLGTLCALDLV